MAVDLIYLSRFNTCCGVSTYTEQLAEAVSKRSVSVSALASDHAGDNCSLREDITSEIPSMVSWSETNVCQALSSVLEQKPRVIHIQHEFGIFKDSAGLLKLCLKIKEKSPETKFVLTAHTVPPGLASAKNDFLKTLRLMDAIIVHSRKARSVICSYPGSLRVPVNVISHGMLAPRERAPRSVAEDWLGLKPDKNRFTLLSLGFITKNKKHVLLSHILSTIKKRKIVHPINIFLIIAGMPPLGEDGDSMLNMLRLAVGRFDMQEDVMIIPKFIPFEDLPYYYGAADMCVHFVERSYHSSSGSIRMDLSYGMPVIAQRAELTEDLSPKTVALFRDTSSFISQLRVISSNKKRLREMSSEAKRMAQNNSWDKTAKIHTMLYRKLSGVDFGDEAGRVRAAIFHSCQNLIDGGSF